MFSKFFIDRPIFATVLSLFLVLAGLAAMRILPIARYPEISPPVVNVRAIYPGASAEVLETTVAAPIEQSINGVEKMLFMDSNSSGDGVVNINVTFDVGTDLDIAAVNVNNRVNQVLSKLPQEVQRQGLTVSKSSAAFLVVASLYSPDDRYDSLFISNYITQNVVDAIKRVPGTTNVQIFGAKDYAMRIWLRPDRMAQLGITVADISAAVSEQNAQYAAGKIGAPPGNTEELTLTVTARGRLLEPEEFGNIVVRSGERGAIVRLRDVARVELGSKDYNFYGRINGHPTVPVGVFLQTGANALETRAAVEKTLVELKAKFPPGLTYSTPYDTTPFVSESIHEVVKTLAEAMVLVFIVVYLFLQSWRATIIPTLAVPVSLIGTMAGLQMLGYSINTLTLFGMVLAIGIVVDDAIVVLENVERLMHEEGLSPRDAAIKAMQEVTGPVVAIVLVLCAAFIPIAFLGGLAGELYRQFSVTISIAVVLSGFVALTLTPALCAVLLKPGAERKNAFFSWFNRSFERFTHRYTRGVAFFLKRGLLGLVLFAGLGVMIGLLARAVPGGLVPDEDQGYYIGAVILPEGSSLERTNAVVKQVEAAMAPNKNLEAVFSLVGLNFLGGGGLKSSAATLFFPLKPWDERNQSAKELVGETYMKTGHIKEGLPLAFAPPAIQGLGQTGGFEFYLQNKGDGGVRRLGQVLPQLLAEANKQPELVGVKTLWQANSPQLFVNVDTEKARSLGLAVADIYNTLAATLGSYYVNDFNKSGRIYQVLMQAEGQYRAKPDDIGALQVRSKTGQMIPIRSVAEVKFVAGPEAVQHFNALPSIQILGDAKPGYSSGQAIAAMERVAAQVLPADMGYDWGGASFQEKRSGGSGNIALAAGFVMIFLILAAQYEKWTLPFTVLLALPFGIFGALLAVYLRNFNNDVYFQIGLVTLLGLSAKNAILIVEFASMKVHEGMTPVAAALEAARLRFRPILMTSLAFILGVVPLAFSSGAGAAARQAIGTGVLGGMLAATFLAIFLVPLFFKIMNDWHLRSKPEDYAMLERPAGALQEPTMPENLMKMPESPRQTLLSSYQKHSAVLVAVTLLSACGVAPLGPDYQRPALDVPARVASSGAATGSAPVDWLAWWKSFQDPVLDALLQEAAANSQDLKLASARIDEARTAIALNNANFVPGVDLTAGATRKRGSQNASSYSAAAGPYSNDRQIGLVASYELDFWGRYARADEAARARLLAQSAAQGTVQATLYASVVQAYVGLRALDAQLTLAEQTLATRQENLRLQQRRFQGGVVGELDLRQAESEAASVQAAAQQARQSRSNAESALALLLGRSPAAIAQPVLARGADFGLLFARQAVPADLPSDLLNRRPDLVAAEQALIAANADIGQARSVYFPRLSFTAALGQQSRDFGNLLDPASLFWNMAANLAQPVFHGGTGDATVAAATARQRQALAQYTQAVQSAFRDVHDALNNVDAGREVAATTARRIEALRSTLRLSQLRYQSGYSAYLEVLNAQRDLAQAEAALIDIQRGQLQAVVGLYRALGGGWDAASLDAALNAKVR